MGGKQFYYSKSEHNIGNYINTPMCYDKTLARFFHRSSNLTETKHSVLHFDPILNFAFHFGSTKHNDLAALRSTFCKICENKIFNHILLCLSYYIVREKRIYKLRGRKGSALNGNFSPSFSLLNSKLKKDVLSAAK